MQHKLIFKKLGENVNRFERSMTKVISIIAGCKVERRMNFRYELSFRHPSRPDPVHKLRRFVEKKERLTCC